MKHLLPEFEKLRARFPAGFESSLVLPCLRRLQEDRGYVADSDIEELAAYLGVPDLHGWLEANALHHQFADPSPYLTQWHYRWALPFTCLVTVLLATPLAIHFSRRGPGGGIFLAVVLSALMLLVSNIVLAFGEAGALHPALAAWLPNLSFALLGLYLFRHRISGRPFYRSIRNLIPNG